MPRRPPLLQAASVAADDGFGIKLDERTLRTPGGAAFAAPTRALADAMAQEWNAQGEHIVPATMPLTQLAFAAIDHTPGRRDELVAYVAKFGETDLVCHRAAAPADAGRAPEPRPGTRSSPGPTHDLGVMLPVVTGVVAAQVAAESCSKTLAAHAGALDDFRLTALAQARARRLRRDRLRPAARAASTPKPPSPSPRSTISGAWSTGARTPKPAPDWTANAPSFENVAQFIAALT